MAGEGVLAPEGFGCGIRCKLLHPIILHDYSTNGPRDDQEAGLDAVRDVVRLYRVNNLQAPELIGAEWGSPIAAAVPLS
jgi:hypothetical protein